MAINNSVRPATAASPESTLQHKVTAVTPSVPRIIVIGSGPVGVRFVQNYYQRQPEASIHLFGNEPYRPYNRVQLSAMLASEVSREAIDLKLPATSEHPKFKFTISVIKCIDPVQKTVTDASGTVHAYDKLILATGARAHIPSVKGVDQTGVYTFRNLKDAEFLYARLARTRHVIVVGGGLLGVEAAKALRHFNTRVTLIQQGPRLMNRQLDDEASSLLQNAVEKFDIEIKTNAGVREIYGNGRVTGVLKYDGETIECDTVLLCAGITPNVEIARAAGLAVRRGIVVDDQLRTSNPDIFAIGECCEHRGLTYGIVNPGYEQAAVAVEAICGSKKSHYVGSQVVNRLKVVGENICSIGEVAELSERPFQKSYIYRDAETGVYRRLVTYRNRLFGVVSVGDWLELSRIQEAFTAQRRIHWYQLARFQRSGSLWSSKDEEDIKSWPATAVICQCNNITQGQLMAHATQGCTTVESLQNKTQAGTVCGSCKPLMTRLVSELGGMPQRLEKEWGSRSLLVTCIAAVAVIAILAAAPEQQSASSVQSVSWFESIWNDKLWKQVTGFSLVGLTLVGLLMSLRKRLGYSWLGTFAAWRLSHASLGTVAALLLILHTGLQLGINLNFFLMLNFLVVLGMGAATGAVVALNHYVNPLRAQKLRSACNWLHIAVSWPLPALILTHIVSVYYF